MHTVRRFLPTVLLSAALTVGIVACGGSTTNADSGSASNRTVTGGAAFGGTDFLADAVAQKVNVAADATGGLKWDKTDYSATAGDVTFVVKNGSTIEHEFAVEGNGIKYTSPTLKGGSNTNLTIKGLKAGEYKITCKTPAHTEAGMVAKLTVK